MRERDEDEKSGAGEESDDEEDDDAGSDSYCCSSVSPQPMNRERRLTSAIEAGGGNPADESMINMGGGPDTVNMGGEPPPATPSAVRGLPPRVGIVGGETLLVEYRSPKAPQGLLTINPNSTLPMGGTGTGTPRRAVVGADQEEERAPPTLFQQQETGPEHRDGISSKGGGKKSAGESEEETMPELGTPNRPLTVEDVFGEEDDEEAEGVVVPVEKAMEVVNEDDDRPPELSPNVSRS